VPVIRSMRPDESIKIGNDITIRAIKVGQERIKLVIDAPLSLPVVHKQITPPDDGARDGARNPLAAAHKP
jgi:hypothetical protein